MRGLTRPYPERICYKSQHVKVWKADIVLEVSENLSLGRCLQLMKVLFWSKQEKVLSVCFSLNQKLVSTLVIILRTLIVAPHPDDELLGWVVLAAPTRRRRRYCLAFDDCDLRDSWLTTQQVEKRATEIDIVRKGLQIQEEISTQLVSMLQN